MKIDNALSNVEAILDLLRGSDKPLKMSEIAKILKGRGYNITQDMVTNYFYNKKYRLVDLMDKHDGYRYSLNKESNHS
jgi:repressor of nif and glnA expression